MLLLLGVDRNGASASAVDDDDNDDNDMTLILLMAEILHQLIGSVSHYLQGLLHPRWLFGISSINIKCKKIETTTYTT